MKRNLLEPFEHLPFFTLEGFKQMLDIGENEDRRARELLSRWGRRGHVLRLKKGVYMVRRFYEFHQGEVGFTPAVSAIIEPQSYLSLEYILQRASVLTEITYPVSAITLKNTKTIQNQVGAFVYRHVRADLYTGFVAHVYFGIVYHEASAAKALFDYLYLRPFPRAFRTHRIDLAEDLRLNVDEFSLEARAEFESFVTISQSEKMAFILENLRRTAWQL